MLAVLRTVTSQIAPVTPFDFSTSFGHVTIGVGGGLVALSLDLDHTGLVCHHKKRNSSWPGFLSEYPFVCPAFLAAAINEARIRGDACLLAPHGPSTVTLSVMPNVGFSASTDFDSVGALLGYAIERRTVSAPFGSSATYLEITLRSQQAQPLLWEHLAVFCLAADAVGREILGEPSQRALLARAGQWIAGHPRGATISSWLSQSLAEEQRLGRTADRRERVSRENRDLWRSYGFSIPAAVDTKLLTSVRVSPDAGAAAARVLSRYTVDPRWLIYLPPGMCAVQSSVADTPLEHPDTALEYYRLQGIRKVIVEEKHAGSRSIVVVCRDEAAGAERFGIAGFGCAYTRNGRAFFRNPDDESRFLGALSETLHRARFWDTFGTTWACFDGELMPWSLKSGELLSELGPGLIAAGETVLAATRHVFRESASPHLVDALGRRGAALAKYRDVVDQQLQEAEAAVNITFAPFHLLATEGRVHVSTSHRWHLDTVRRIARVAPQFLQPTFALATELDDVNDCARVRAWWADRLCREGAEGVVVKPWRFVSEGKRGLAQPALKCRTPEYLRVVYGLEYDSPRNRATLAARPGMARRREKHRRVVRQFAMSIEGLERFVAAQGTARTLECVCGVLALDSPD